MVYYHPPPTVPPRHDVPWDRYGEDDPPTTANNFTLAEVEPNAPMKNPMPGEYIFTSPGLERVPPTTGVPGVRYATLPPGSMHKDPGHKPRGAPSDPVWIFDTGAGIPGFNNRYGLSSFAILDKPVVVGGIVAEKNLTVGTCAVLDNISVLYDERFGANCLPSSVIVDAGWKVKYHDNADCYVVTTASKKRLIFQRFVMGNGAVTKHYLCHPGLPLCNPLASPNHVIAATSVQGNLSMHSRQDAKNAAVAQRFLTKMGGSAAHGIARLPMLRGIDITADHVRKAQAIYGPVRSHAQSVATSVQDVPVTNELPSERAKPVPQALAVDLVLIMGVWTVLGIFLPCRYMAVAAIKDRSAPAIYSAMKTMIYSALKRNFDVVKIQADGERGIHSPELDDLCARHHIETLKVGAGQHEANAERSARTLKSEVRNIAQRVIPRSLPRELLEQLIIAAATSINARASTLACLLLSPVTRVPNRSGAEQTTCTRKTMTWLSETSQLQAVPTRRTTSSPARTPSWCCTRPTTDCTDTRSTNSAPVHTSSETTTR